MKGKQMDRVRIISTGVVGNVVGRSNGWVTVEWPNGMCGDFYLPTVNHGMEYLDSKQGEGR